MSKHKAALFICAAFFIGACGKDKTVTEYQREKLQQNLALYQSVAGNYTGVVTSKQDGRIIGAMEIELRADTVVNPSAGGETALGTPVLVSNIRFLDENVIALSAPNSFYDPSTGSYSAQITIARGGGSADGGAQSGSNSGETGSPGATRSSAGSSNNVVITGVLRSNTLIGEIGTSSFPEFGGKFELQRDGKPITELAHLKTPSQLEADKESRQVSAYSGTTSFESGAKKAVHIVILQPIKGTAEDFLDLVNPIKSVQVSFNYSQSLHVLFSGAIFDTRQGLLTGQSFLAVNGQVQQMNLECRTSQSSEISCKHLTSGSGVTATTKAKINLNGPQAPPNDAKERAAVTKVFHGYGKGGITGPMSIAVTLPSRGRLADLTELFFPNAEKIVNVGVTFAKNTSMSFMNVKWDSLNGLIEGSLQGTGDGGYTAYLQCSSFYFTKTTGPFSCSYWTSRSPAINIDFKPPFR